MTLSYYPIYCRYYKDKQNNMEYEKEWDEEVEKVQHDVHEPTTYELAEAELKAEERAHKYLWDSKYAL